MFTREPGVAVHQVCKKSIVGTRDELTMRIPAVILVIIVSEKNISIDNQWCVGDNQERIIVSTIVDRMRIERRDLVHPDALHSEQFAHFANDRSATAVADQMNRQLRKRMATEC